ncbi:AMP-binding protein [Streptomyces sp. M19]
MYTSGTTGDPKGVVLSHRNVIHESLMQDLLVPVPEHPRTVAYLPTAHIAERVLGIYMPIVNAGHVTICPHPDQLVPTLLAVRPTGSSAYRGCGKSSPRARHTSRRRRPP